ncbi:MAG: hypothetical protein ACFE9S_16400 [Candidatus Hermodarchaeota archaeon]
MSPDNIFELITISGEPVSNFEESKFKVLAYKWDLLLLMNAIVLFLIFFLLLPYLLDFNVPIPIFIGVSILLIFSYVVIILIRSRKKVK